MSAYRVCGPVAAIKDDTGKLRYYYHGSPVPADLPAAQLKRLEDVGLLEKTEPQIVPGLGVAVVPGQRPKDNAAKSVWVAYAVSQGMDQSEADKLTAAQLAAQYPAAPPPS